MSRFVQRTFPVLLLIIVSAVLFTPIQRLFERHLQMLQENLVGRLEGLIGYEVSYSSISPSLLVTIEIRDFSLEDEGQRLLTVDRLRFSYNLFQLIRGNFYAAITAIRIENGNIQIDADSWQQLRATVQNLSGPTTDDSDPSLAELIDDLRISGRNISVVYGDNERDYRFAGMSFDIDASSALLSVRSNGAIVISDPLLPVQLGIERLNEVEVLFSMRGTIRDFADVESTIVIESLITPLFRLQNQSFAVQYRDEELVVRKVRDRSPLNLLFSADLDSGNVQLQFETERFVPADFLSLHGSLAPFDPWAERRFFRNYGHRLRHD